MAGQDSDTTWARWLRQALTDRAWSARELALALSVAESTVSKWLAGQNPPKDLETVIKIAHLLGARDAIEAAEAAGMHRAADLIRRETKAAEDDPMIGRIRSADLLSETDRETMIENYRQRQRETIHYFELQLAEAERRKRAERDRRTRRDTPDRAAQ